MLKEWKALEKKRKEKKRKEKTMSISRFWHECEPLSLMLITVVRDAT
jgi:hypothetical protein